jgi:hypothetical protein
MPVMEEALNNDNNNNDSNNNNNHSCSLKCKLYSTKANYKISCEIHDGESGTDAAFSSKFLQFFHNNNHSTIVLYLSITDSKVREGPYYAAPYHILGLDLSLWGV